MSVIRAIQEGKVRYLASSGLPELKYEIVKKFINNRIISYAYSDDNIRDAITKLTNFINTISKQ